MDGEILSINGIYPLPPLQLGSGEYLMTYYSIF